MQYSNILVVNFFVNTSPNDAWFHKKNQHFFTCLLRWQRGEHGVVEPGSVLDVNIRIREAHAAQQISKLWKLQEQSLLSKGDII